MWSKIVVCLLVVAISCSSDALLCDDNKRCRTGECDSAGQCLCNLPDPSTLLDGDRPFFGGRFCDEEHVMCDGTNSFWCENGGVCQEIIQGEKYSCKCPPGFIGEHCEHSGSPCGNNLCFHEAECIQDRHCACPSAWKGSLDCALPTKIEHALNDTAPSFVTTNYRGEENEWLVPFISAVVAVGILGSAVSLTKKFNKKREVEAAKFQQLSQMQIHGFLDEDDDDNALITHGSH